MKLYLAWWDNAQEWDDQEVELIGIFSTLETAKIEGEKYIDNLKQMNERNKKSFFFIEQWVLDTPISRASIFTSARKEPYNEH